jgi:multidrug efflux pump
MASISEPFIRRPVATTLLSIGLLLLGVVAYEFLPVSLVPNVDFPAIFVSASRPGAGPSVMAATVAAPLERRLGEIAGIDQITSTSSLGVSNIQLQFNIGRDIDRAARDVQAAINASLVDLPSDLPALPSFRKANTTGIPAYVLALTSKTLSTSAIYDVADTVLAQRISQVPGVGNVTIAGADQPAVRIQLNPVALSNAGIATDDVRTAIVNANPLGPVGIFDGERQSETLALNRQMRTAQEFRDIIRSSAGGDGGVAGADLARGVEAGSGGPAGQLLRARRPLVAGGERAGADASRGFWRGCAYAVLRPKADGAGAAGGRSLAAA